MSFNVHDHYKDLSVEDLKLISNATRLPYAVCLLNLEYDLNIGNCIRSAHIFGVLILLSIILMNSLMMK